METRTTIQVSKLTRERFRQTQSWEKETDDVLLNKLLNRYGMYQKSPCRICKKMCVNELLKEPVKIDGRMEWFLWKHVEEQGHPSYPVADTDAKEAVEDYKKFQKEMIK
jgi:ribonuclease HI